MSEQKLSSDEGRQYAVAKLAASVHHPERGTWRSEFPEVPYEKELPMEQHEHQPYDIEPEVDDSEAVEAYAKELKEAAEAFGIEVREPGGDQPAPEGS